MAAALLESWQEFGHAGRTSQPPICTAASQGDTGHVQTELVCSLNGTTFRLATVVSIPRTSHSTRHLVPGKQASHLDNVAQHPVGHCIGRLHLLPLLAQPQTESLHSKLHHVGTLCITNIYRLDAAPAPTPQLTSL